MLLTVLGLKWLSPGKNFAPKYGPSYEENQSSASGFFNHSFLYFSPHPPPRDNKVVSFQTLVSRRWGRETKSLEMSAALSHRKEIES